MSKPLIAVDIDDTLANSTETLITSVNDRFDVSIPREAYYKPGEYWGYYNRVWVEHGLELKEDEIDEKMVVDRTQLALLPSALFVINKLKNRFNFVIITARNPERESMTKAWLAEMLPDISVDVHFSEAHRDESKLTKGQICKKLGVEYLVDDNVGHCVGATKEGVTGVLFGEYGWHQDAPDDLVRCKDWPAVLEYFESI
jgi:5'(3')-deoxyribonucleotidase